MTATHYLYYFNDDGQLSRADWPPSGGGSAWDNYIHGTVTIEATLNDSDLTGGSDLIAKAGVVLGGATNGTSIWVAGTPYDDDGFNYVVWRIDAADLTTILDGPNWLKDNDQVVHLGTAPDYGSLLIPTGSDYYSEALVAWGINDTNNPSPPHVCSTFSPTSAHKFYTSLDGLATFIDSPVIPDVGYTVPGVGCPIQNKSMTQWINFDRMQGTWQTNDGHTLFVWIICRTDTDVPDDGDRPEWNASSMYYDIHARLDSSTSYTITRIARSPGIVDNCMFSAGWGNGIVGYDKATDRLHCYLQMDMDAHPGDSSFIYHASFSRTGSSFTLDADWTATTIHQTDAVSVEGSQLLGGSGNHLPADYPFTESFSVDHGATWNPISTDLPGTSHLTPSFARWYNASGFTGGAGGDWAYTAMARIVPAVIESTDRVGILVNWDNDDDWLSHAEDDVTSQVVDIDLSIVAANPRIEVDTLTVTLKDPHGNYVPAHIASALYPNVRLSRQLRWNLTIDGITECRFHGTIAEYTPLLGDQSSTSEQQCRIRAESPLRALASAQVPLTNVPSGVLVNPDGVTGVIPTLLAIVSGIIPSSTWLLDPTPDSIDPGFLTEGMTIQTALEQCAIFADAIYSIRPHYRATPSPKFYFRWQARGIVKAAFADHVWTDTGGDIGQIIPRYTGDII